MNKIPDDFLSMKPKSPLKELRKRFPREHWRAERMGFGWQYKNADGEHANYVALLAPRYDGDDDTFDSQFWVYRKSGSERLW